MKKYLILILFLTFPNFAYANNIIEYYKVNNIKKIIILNYSNMDISKEAYSAKILDNKELLTYAKNILKSLSIDGKKYKDFGKNTPTTRVVVMHDNDKYFELTIYDVYIRAPRGEGGTFGLGEREEEFVDLLNGRN